MYNVYKSQYGRDLKEGEEAEVSFEEFKNSPEHQDQAARDLGGNVNGGHANGKFYHICPEYDTCSVYNNVCGGNPDGYELTEYFECTEVEKNNGQKAYVGPHCSSDGFTITLGVFSDQYCNEYIGNSVSVSNFIGMDFNEAEDPLKSWYNSANGMLDMLEYSNEDDVCIPCRMKVSSSRSYTFISISERY